MNTVEKGSSPVSEDGSGKEIPSSRGIISMIEEYENYGQLKAEAWNTGTGVNIHDSRGQGQVENALQSYGEKMEAMRPKMEAAGIAFKKSGAIDLDQSSEAVRRAVAEYKKQE